MEPIGDSARPDPDERRLAVPPHGGLAPARQQPLNAPRASSPIQLAQPTSTQRRGPPRPDQFAGSRIHDHIGLLPNRRPHDSITACQAFTFLIKEKICHRKERLESGGQRTGQRQQS